MRQGWNQRLLTVVAILGLAGAAVVAQAGDLGVGDFDTAAYEKGRIAMYESMDTGVVAEMLSEYYNDQGLSKAEELIRMERFFDKYEWLNARHRVLAFRLFPESNVGSAWEILEVTGQPVDGGEPEVVIRTRGYASLIHEAGQWRIYGIQLSEHPKWNVDYARETGEDWEGWSVSAPRSGDTDKARMQQETEPTPTFDAKPWVATRTVAYKNKDADLLHSQISRSLYNEDGDSWREYYNEELERMEVFDEFVVRYRIIDFKTFPGTEIGAAKAILEMDGRLKGEKEMKPLIKTMGYAAMVFEEGEWKLYGTSPPYRDWVMDFDFSNEKSTEAWPRWKEKWSRTVAEE